MALSSVAKGKKRAVEEEHEDTSPLAEAPVLKRSKSRAETRPCPICKEKIPLRLLGKHAALEAERIESIIQQIGSEEPIRDEYEEDVGTSSRSRLSAMKARKFIAPRTAKADAMEKSIKTVQAIKRHRKQRHAKLKEMLKEDDETPSRRNPWSKGLVGGQLVCPICSTTVRGDEGVLEAHVDTCVANEDLRLEEQAQQEALQRQYEEEAQWESQNNDRGNYVGNLQGAGFHTRNRQNQDCRRGNRHRRG
ncbi:hypothetical protein DFP72DRAFT_598783 [Ephemerocybe angulata]|uniref:E3 ubiquitin-protein ligase RNF220 middle domain-containing protein n=1 Tax=Ephemerocybe angulata TaxID=980116 RepID=A0A8H6IDF4_9AGAR|nr:hypothetical protein DFP72DRAFT_598783 [Tulosesus angulatus]